LWRAVPPGLNDNNPAAKFSLVRNVFPYHMEKGIEHYVLWKLGGPPGAGISKEEIEASVSGLRKRTPATFIDNKGRNSHVRDVLYWVNPPSLQSLPNIRHAHVLCLTTTPKHKS
jgi:Protein of unknown function (DUF3605)